MTASEWLAGIFGGFVFAGVAFEVWLAYTRPSPSTNLGYWGPVWADVIVAVGIGLELLFGFRGNHLQGVLTKRAKEEVARATQRAVEAQGLAAQASGQAEEAFGAAEDARNELSGAMGMAAQASAQAAQALQELTKATDRLAAAEERAAKLEKEAAEARERTAEIERITAPRRLSPADRQGIIDFVRPRAASLKLLVQAQSSDAEAFSYARSIATAFKKAGVEKIELTVTSFASGLVFGVHMQSDVLDLDDLQELDKFIESPFILSRRDLSMTITLSHFRPDLYIFVGPRVTPGTFADDGDEDAVQPTIVG